MSDLGWGRELAGGAQGGQKTGAAGAGEQVFSGGRPLDRSHSPDILFTLSEHLHCARCRVGLRCSGVTSSR